MKALPIAIIALLLTGCDPNAELRQQDKRAIKTCEKIAAQQLSPKSMCNELREKYKERWGKYPNI